MKYTTASIMNLTTLFVGIAIGFALAPKVEKNVLAQQKPVPTCVNTATVDCVAPTFTVGSAGIGTLLVHQVAADQLTVNGYDVLKLQNNMINTLVERGVITIDAARALANNSRPDKQLRIQTFAPPAPAVPAPGTRN